MSDIQSNVTIDGANIYGTLKYQDSGALADYWGDGNFLALDFSDNTFTGITSLKVGLEPSVSSGLVEAIEDTDKNGVFKITDPLNQKFVIVQTMSTGTRKQTYDLSHLVLETA